MTSPRIHVLLGAGILAGIVAAVLAVDTGWLHGQFQPGGQIVRARFADTAQLKHDDPVRVHGVDVGRVQSMTLDPGGRTATVAMVIQRAGQPIYNDARAMLRWRTVLGANFSVDLDPGSPRAGLLGSKTIPPSQTTNQVEIEDAIAFDQGSAKQGMRVMLRELPAALRDPQTLSGALGALGDQAPSLTRAISAVRGIGEGDLRPLVSATARTVQALDAPANALQGLIQDAAATLTTTAHRQADLQALLDRGAGVQPEVQRTLNHLWATLNVVDPLLRDVRRPAAQLAPTLSRLQPTLDAATALLDSAEPLVHDLRPAVSSLATAARAGRPLLAGLQPGLARLADTTLPSLAVTDPVTKLKTYEMIGPVIASLDSASASYDAESHLFRFPAGASERAGSDDLPCATFFTDPESPALARCNSLSRSFNTFFGGLAAMPKERP